MDKDNANPTILNVSELPTRQSKKRVVATSKDAGSELDFVLRRPEYLSSPFCDLSWTSDETESDDGFTIEPIDEQEIYGTLLLFFRRLSSLSASQWTHGMHGTPSITTTTYDM